MHPLVATIDPADLATRALVHQHRLDARALGRVERGIDRLLELDLLVQVTPCRMSGRKVRAFPAREREPAPTPDAVAPKSYVLKQPTVHHEPRDTGGDIPLAIPHQEPARAQEQQAHLPGEGAAQFLPQRA